MNRGIYATASGMVGAQHLLDTITNNLANASTAGFKKEGVAFDDAYSQALRANGGEGRDVGTLGTGPEMKGRFTDMAVGTISVTGNPLDVAISSAKGFFAVQDTDGLTRYVRDGSFSKDANGDLVNRSGYKVLDDRGVPINLPQGDAKIEEDGTISVNGNPESKIGVWDGKFTKLSGTEFASANASVISEPELKPGAIEGSNVNPIETMVEMISLNRGFEMGQRSIVQQDELTEKLIQSLNQ